MDGLRRLAGGVGYDPAAGSNSCVQGSLAEDVLGVSGLLQQDSEDSGRFTLSVEGAHHRPGAAGGLRFELGRDDALQLIGLLNTHEIDIARREFQVLLKRLQRPAIEGIAHRLFAAVTRRGGVAAAAAARRAKPTRGTSLGGQGSLSTPALSAASGRSPRGVAEARLQSRAAAGRELVQPPLGEEEEAMPSVFRRLTAGSSAPRLTESPERALAEMDRMLGGISAGGGGPAADRASDVSVSASTLIDQVLLAHDVHSRGAGGTEDGRRTPRVSEEKAREIFDRLYQSGKEFRVRKRVYQEMGLLVQKEREATDCTFEPRVPLAARREGPLEGGSVTERLYRDSADRRRRREELAQNAPSPPFRPQTTATALPANGLRRRSVDRFEGTTPPSASASDPFADDAAAESGGAENACAYGEDGGAFGRSARGEPPHFRLFREHAERRARHERRQDEEAEWRKHSYRPNISSSQASGPQVLPRQHSLQGLPTYNSSTGITEDEYGREPYFEQLDAAAPLTPPDSPGEQALEDGPWDEPAASSNCNSSGELATPPGVAVYRLATPREPQRELGRPPDAMAEAFADVFDEDDEAFAEDDDAFEVASSGEASPAPPAEDYSPLAAALPAADVGGQADSPLMAPRWHVGDGEAAGVLASPVPSRSSGVPPPAPARLHSGPPLGGSPSAVALAAPCSGLAAPPCSGLQAPAPMPPAEASPRLSSAGSPRVRALAPEPVVVAVHRQASSPVVPEAASAPIARSYSGWLPASPLATHTPRTPLVHSPPPSVARSMSNPVIGAGVHGVLSPRLALTPATPGASSPRAHLVVQSAVLPPPPGSQMHLPMSVAVAAVCTSSGPPPPSAPHRPVSAVPAVSLSAWREVAAGRQLPTSHVAKEAFMQPAAAPYFEPVAAPYFARR